MTNSKDSECEEVLEHCYKCDVLLPISKLIWIKELDFGCCDSCMAKMEVDFEIAYENELENKEEL